MATSYWQAIHAVGANLNLQVAESDDVVLLRGAYRKWVAQLFDFHPFAQHAFQTLPFELAAQPDSKLLDCSGGGARNQFTQFFRTKLQQTIARTEFGPNHGHCFVNSGSFAAVADAGHRLLKRPGSQTVSCEGAKSASRHVLEDGCPASLE